MSWGSRLTIAVLGVLCLVMAARARWASDGSLRHVLVPTSRTGFPSPGAAVGASDPGPNTIPNRSALERSAAQERQARAAAIRETIEVIQAECRSNAGGDWARWSEQLRPVRDDLVAKIRKARAFNPEATGYFEARSPVLEGRDNFSLFEPAPDHYLQHVVEPASLDRFRNERSVVAAARWLKQQGIDVIFVPVPKMTEIYPEYFTDHCPDDRIIAPHLRQAILELLDADVEVVDLLHAFQKERDKDLEPLYQPADPHWGPRAQEIAAQLVAARLKRYAFVASAQASRPICRLVTAPFALANASAAYEALTPDQRRRADAAQPRAHLMATDFNSPQFDDSAPVACIGDSYNFGFMERLIPELNLPVRALAGGGNTTDAFKGFLRNPELLKDCKVVIWLVCNSALKSPWPLPDRIQKVGRSSSPTEQNPKD